MIQHNIIDILKSLTPKDLRKLTEFLSSPYFNESSKLLDLYKEIISFHPTFEDENFTREHIGKRLNSKGIYKDPQLRDYLSKLLSLVKEFLIIERLQTRNDLKLLLILNDVSDRDISRLFGKYRKELDTYTNKKGWDRDSYVINFHSSAQAFNYNSTNSKIKKSIQAENEILEMFRCGENLLISNFISLVLIYVNVTTHKNKFSIEVEDNELLGLIDILLEKISPMKLEKSDRRIIELYTFLFLAFRHLDDSGHYYKYKEDFKKKKTNLSNEEVKFHNAKLIAYCILQKKASSDNSDWNKELFEHYKHSIDQKLYLTRYEKYLSHNLYRDVLINVINLNKTDWLKKFIDEHTPSLHPKYRRNMKTYALAYLAFHKRQYAKSIELSKKVDLDYFIYKYDVKNLKIAACYEQHNISEVDELIHAYEEALRKEKLLPKSQKINYKNFLLYVRKLITYSNNKTNLGYFFEKLLREKQIVYKKWLVDKYQLNITSLQYKIPINY